MCTCMWMWIHMNIHICICACTHVYTFLLWDIFKTHMYSLFQFMYTYIYMHMYLLCPFWFDTWFVFLCCRRIHFLRLRLCSCVWLDVCMFVCVWGRKRVCSFCPFRICFLSPSYLPLLLSSSLWFFLSLTHYLFHLPGIVWHPSLPPVCCILSRVLRSLFRSPPISLPPSLQLFGSICVSMCHSLSLCFSLSLSPFIYQTTHHLPYLSLFHTHKHTIHTHTHAHM